MTSDIEHMSWDQIIQLRAAALRDLDQSNAELAWLDAIDTVKADDDEEDKVTTTTALKLYRPETLCSDWPVRDGRYKGVRVTWLMWHREQPVGDYRALLDGYYARTNYAGQTWVAGHDVVDELFTADEAALLVEYLKTTYGEDVTLEEVVLPVAISDPDAADYMAFSAAPFGGDCDLHMLWKEKGYTLPFQVGGYYDLERDPDAALISRRVHCPHHGDEYIEVSPCDPVNQRRRASATWTDEVPF